MESLHLPPQASEVKVHSKRRVLHLHRSSRRRKLRRIFPSKDVMNLKQHADTDTKSLVLSNKDTPSNISIAEQFKAWETFDPNPHAEIFSHYDEFLISGGTLCGSSSFFFEDTDVYGTVNRYQADPRVFYGYAHNHKIKPSFEVSPETSCQIHCLLSNLFICCILLLSNG